MEGIWLDSASGFYVHIGEDGQFSVAGDAEATEVGEWGDYTCNGESFTLNNAAESPYCPDTSVTWTFEFSDDGDEVISTFVEDSCVGSPRSQDKILLRQSS